MCFSPANVEYEQVQTRFIINKRRQTIVFKQALTQSSAKLPGNDPAVHAFSLFRWSDSLLDEPRRQAQPQRIGFCEKMTSRLLMIVI